ncbi:MAG TPA: transcription antitermination factor NusB [Thermoanaerobaculia bacterium]|nr:transcription antitermination factor NusB [Thermoanaerobaculia bacterium]
MARAVSPARRRAVAVLREILEKSGRSNLLLAEKSRDLAPPDADLLRAIVLGVLRHKTALDAEIASVSRVPLPRLAPNLREILEVGLFQVRHLDRVPAYAAVDDAVSHAKARGGTGAGGLVNAILRNLLRRPPEIRNPKSEIRNAGPERLAVHYSHPKFLVERWLERFGAQTTAGILDADNAPSALDLMTNPRRGDRESLRAALAAEGVETAVSPLSPLALSVVSGNPLRSPLFAAGRFTVQDVGSQLLPLLLPPGELLVDLAAAPGGKSFSAVLHGRVKRSIALDSSSPRLRLLLENRSRLDVPEVAAAAGDVLAPPLAAGLSDRVLFDAPCSGTGTLRKNPEIRYRVTPEAIERLSRAQESGLESAASLLAPGGYLLYSTCSLELEENERVVERVLARSAEIRPAAIEAPEALRTLVSGHRFRILPGPTTDGFTAHLIRRAPAG